MILDICGKKLVYREYTSSTFNLWLVKVDASISVHDNITSDVGDPAQSLLEKYVVD